MMKRLPMLLSILFAAGSGMVVLPRPAEATMVPVDHEVAETLKRGTRC